jgi:hypothetical protein
MLQQKRKKWPSNFYFNLLDLHTSDLNTRRNGENISKQMQENKFICKSQTIKTLPANGLLLFLGGWGEGTALGFELRTLYLPGWHSTA